MNSYSGHFFDPWFSCLSCKHWYAWVLRWGGYSKIEISKRKHYLLLPILRGNWSKHEWTQASELNGGYSARLLVVKQISSLSRRDLLWKDKVGRSWRKSFRPSTWAMHDMQTNNGDIHCLVHSLKVINYVSSLSHGCPTQCLVYFSALVYFSGRVETRSRKPFKAEMTQRLWIVSQNIRWSKLAL